MDMSTAKDEACPGKRMKTTHEGSGSEPSPCKVCQTSLKENLLSISTYHAIIVPCLHQVLQNAFDAD